MGIVSGLFWGHIGILEEKWKVLFRCIDKGT